jgi:hypothetical protein
MKQACPRQADGKVFNAPPRQADTNAKLVISRIAPDEYFICYSHAKEFIYI